MHEWAGPAFLVAFSVAFVWMAIAFLRRARQRRREMFAEDTPRLVREPPEGIDGEGAEAESAEVPEEPVAEVEAEVTEAEPEPEPEDEPEPAVEAAPVEIDPALQEGLAKTKSGLFSRLGNLFGGGAVDPKLLDELEDALLLADVGVRLSTRLLDELRAEIDAGKLEDGAALRAALKERMLSASRGATRQGDPLAAGGGAKPRVILFVGVNGVGKTTTIGKIASKLTAQDHSVVLAAGDTFRAAATEQLGIWGERAGCKVIKGEEGTDPASVIFNAIQHGVQIEADFVLADTAGRLHTKTELMDEIRKVKRAASKARSGAPDEIWLVVDATTGQNAVRQADEFHQALELTGVILTKLDGTAKGGVVVAIADTLSLPVLYVGVGEKAEDLRPFEATAFIEALFAA